MRVSWWLRFNFAVSGVFLLGAADSAEVVFNEDIEVLHAERMVYPLAGRVHVVQGAVVVRVDLAKNGTVRQAAAVSGPRLLIDECLRNAKTWQFRRTSKGTAFIIYIFRIKGVCELPCPSYFEFYPPNVALISMGSPLVTP